MMEICLFWALVIHFDFDTTSGKTDGKLLTGMKNHFDTAEFSSKAPVLNYYVTAGIMGVAGQLV